MWKWTFLLAILAGLFLAACDAGQPQITIETIKIDLGDVVNGEVIVREVAVQNTGERELVIETVSTSCGCTQAWLEPANIAPGFGGALHIEFDSGAHGPDENGHLTRQVFIATNDPQRAEIVLDLSANVLPPPAP